MGSIRKVFFGEAAKMGILLKAILVCGLLTSYLTKAGLMPSYGPWCGVAWRRVDCSGARTDGYMEWRVEKMVKKEFQRQLESNDAVNELISDMKQQMLAEMQEQVEREVEKQVVARMREEV